MAGGFHSTRPVWNRVALVARAAMAAKAAAANDAKVAEVAAVNETEVDEAAAVNKVLHGPEYAGCTDGMT